MIALTAIFAVACASGNVKQYAAILDSKNQSTSSGTEMPGTAENNASGDLTILEIYDRVYNAAYDSKTDTFYEKYCGAYVDDEGKLNLLYSGDMNGYLDWLRENGIDTLSEKLVFSEVDKNYEYLYAMKKEIDRRLANLIGYNNNRQGDPVEPVSLRVCYINDETNKVHLEYDVSVYDGLVDYEHFEPWQVPEEARYMFSKEQDEYLEIVFLRGSKYEDFSDDIEYVYPGQALYSVRNSSAGQYKRISIGIRAQYAGEDDVPYFGFLTVAHGFEGAENNNAYIRTGSLLKKIGTKLWGVKDTSNGIDVAFVAFDSGYEMTDTVYYMSYYPVTGTAASTASTSPSSNADEIYYRNYYTVIPRGYFIYTNGSTTGKTTGKMIAFETTVCFNDFTAFYHSAMVTNHFSHGDSGGIAYSNATSGGVFDSFITVGLIKGGDEENGWYVLSTYARLRYFIDNYPGLCDGLSFLTIY